jgi:photosystem II stability/assembly factor-like uncharacterized protein/predicted small secreted protein
MHRYNKFIGAGAALGLAALMLTACATAQPTGQQSARAASTSQSGAGRGRTGPGADSARPVLSPISVSFISASTGWLLALPPCAARGCQALRLRKTTDGGRHWFAVPAPPAPAWNDSGRPADAVSGILFADAEDGWAFGPGLWATHDGGQTWHQVRLHAGPVFGLAAGHGRVIAAGRCRSGYGRCRFAVFGSPAGADRWRRVPGAAGIGVGPAGVLVSGRTGYVVDTTVDVGKPVLLSGPADGSASWKPLRNPCQGAWSAPLAARGRWVVLGCGTEPGAGEQVKLVYLSRDRGRTWRRLSDPPVGGYLTDASITKAGTIFISGGRSDVYMSWNGGRSWHTSRSLLRADIGDGLSATMVTDDEGFVLQASSYEKQIWFTRDGGQIWTPESVR